MPFHVDNFASIFMENLRLVAITLSEAKVSEYISLYDYNETQFLGKKNPGLSRLVITTTSTKMSIAT